jgi:WXG100 family type VII secretion target
VSFSYAVDLDVARDVVSSLASVEGELSEVMVDLHWRISHLHALWSGTAAGAHLEAHRGWEASYAEMHDALVAMRRAVHTASESYSAAGTDNASMWGQVR